MQPLVTVAKMRPALIVALAALGAAALAAPFLLEDFTIFQVTQVLVYAIAIVGLNLLTGVGGQFSLGHGAFFAAGAYVAAWCLSHGALPYPLAIAAAGVICFSLGYCFGFPALRLDGIYLALATFSLAVAVPQILKLSLLEHWTGGVGGIVLTKPSAPFGLPLSDDQWLYFVVLAVFLVLFVLTTNLIRGRTGRAIRAVRDNQAAARAMGVNVTRTKVMAFGYSAMITGVAGAMSALLTQFVAPDSFNLFLSINLLVGLVVGGVGWLPGALAGAAFIYFLPMLAEQISQAMNGLIYGVLLIVVMLFAPRGLGALLGR